MAERRGVWREIVRYVQRDVPRVDAMIELGAGYGDFINQFPARRRIAFDLNPEMRRFVDERVELRVEDCVPLAGIDDGSIDFVFASNFLEHLGADEVERLLSSVARVLRPGGRIVLLQPNHARCADHYFDDPTHKTIFDHRNIVPTLSRHGLSIVRIEPGLLPFSMKSLAPKWPILVRLYLSSPVRPGAAQMYVVAEKS
jgi:SAM-dependent methyltransferase